MEKMRMESVDMIARNIERIGELFPNCITETADENGTLKKAVNFELLKQMLSDDVFEGDEAYEFTWVGKKASIVEANKPIRKTLRPCKEESVNWDTTENLYIEGDNLEVLKLLQENYLGKVKMIYIDPPYNTGNDFIYNDDFKMTGEEYSEEIGEYNEEGNRMFKNTETNGRFHSDWCSMIFPRLMLARNLLSDDGVIFISIDDNEQENLKKICDEVFGGSNFLNTVAVKMSEASGVKMSHADKKLPKLKEYLLIYKKSNKGKLHSIKIDKDGWDPEYSTIMLNISKKEFELMEIIVENDNRTVEDMKYVDDILKKAKIESILNYCKNEGIVDKEEKIKFLYENAYRIFRTTATSVSFVETIKNFIRKNRVENQFFSYLTPENKLYILKNIINTEMKKPRMQLLFANKYLQTNPGDFWQFIKTTGLDNEGGVDFKNGKKPLKLLSVIQKISDNKNSITLDFFSGSASMAESIMRLNAEDSGNRKFIMVQFPELTDEKSEAHKAGYKNICEIGKERIRRAGKKILEENKDKEGIENLDIGFRVLKLDDSNMNDVYYNPSEYTQDLLSMLESNVKSDRNDLDLLFGCLLEWGLPLSLPYRSEQMEGCTVHNYNDGDLIACFDEKIPDSVIKEIAKKQPLRAVFRDSGFADSPSKINVGEIFKLLAPETRVKVI